MVGNNETLSNYSCQGQALLHFQKKILLVLKRNEMPASGNTEGFSDFKTSLLLSKLYTE